MARQSRDGRQLTLSVSSTHGEQRKARRAYWRIARFLGQSRQTAEQLGPVQRWYRIVSEVRKRYPKGRPRDQPVRLEPA